MFETLELYVYVRKNMYIYFENINISILFPFDWAVVQILAPTGPPMLGIVYFLQKKNDGTLNKH